MGMFGKKRNPTGMIEQDMAKLDEQMKRIEEQRLQLQQQMQQQQNSKQQQQATQAQMQKQAQESMEASSVPAELPFDKGAEKQSQEKGEKPTLDQWLYAILANVEEIRNILGTAFPKKGKGDAEKKSGRPKKKKSHNDDDDYLGGDSDEDEGAMGV